MHIIKKYTASPQYPRLIFTWVCIAFSQATFAHISLNDEPEGQSYHFTTHHRIEIAAPPSVVWPILLDVKSWMYEFELAPLAGEPGTEGHVLNLYGGQDFKIQFISVVPEKLLAIANLPLQFRGEDGTGIGVNTLHATDHGTEVVLTLSRRYTWTGEGSNPVRATRASADFQENTRAMWDDRFLARLKSLAEKAQP